MFKSIAVVAVASIALALAGCGGGRSSDAPSKEEVAKAVSDNPDAFSDFVEGDAEANVENGDVTFELSKKTVDCITNVLYDSEISDSYLSAMVTDGPVGSPSSEDTEAVRKVNLKMADDCAPAK